MGSLDGKVALVTGGASGIGRACAERLAQEGAVVVVTDLQDAKGAEVVEAIRAAGGKAEYHHHDVTSEAAWIEVASKVKAAHGRLDILVNNAGIGISASVLDMSLADFQRQVAINVDGVFLGTKHSIPVMRLSGDGGSIKANHELTKAALVHLAAVFPQAVEFDALDRLLAAGPARDTGAASPPSGWVIAQLLGQTS